MKTASRLIPIEAFDNFIGVKDVLDAEITATLVSRVRRLDERDEIEPFIRCILADLGQTPHGPAELVDIFTHKVSVGRQFGMAAFLLKGKSFPTVRPSDVGHQIYRLKKMDGITVAVFAAAGTILDQAKEQFVTTCQEIGCNYAIFGAVELARLFVAYGFICPRDGKLISAGHCSCGYSPQKKALNLLQTEALDELANARRQRRSSALVVLPPGSGKTRIAAEDAKRVNAKRILFVAHTHEILDGAYSEFTAKFGNSAVCRPTSPADLEKLETVTIATIQLLAHNLKRVSSTRFDYVAVDEFHHAAAPSYRTLLETLNPAFTLGLTATPWRGDGQKIAELCSNVIVTNHDLRYGIETGILSPYHYYGCFDDIDYSNIQHNGRQYDVRDLERALIVPARDRAIILKWAEKAEGRPTLAFCCTIRHAKRVAAHFRAAGVDAEVYTSEMRRHEREQALKKFHSKQISVLCVVDVLNEGADFPFVECLLFLRPTESRRIFYQQLGRGLRKHPGKKFCLVIDFIGHFINAQRIIDYQGLLAFGDDDFDYAGLRKPKEILNLPTGCEVHFDEKVIDVFAAIANAPDNVTPRNVERILLYQFDRLAQRLGRHPTRTEIDRSFILGSEIYKTRWGSWRAFETAVAGREILARN